MFSKTINHKNAQITVKVVRTSSGYQVQNHLTSEAQNGILYGKTYKSEKRANAEAAKWIEYQIK
jgi:hypothetical protein